MAMNNEEQQTLRGFHMVRRHSHKREFSEIALLQEAPRVKRQFCGAMMQGHRGDIFDRRREMKFSRNATFVEGGQHFGELSTGFHDLTDCNTWHLQYADYSRTCLEKRSPSSSLFTFPCFQSAMETSHFLSSDSMVNFTTSPSTHSCGSSRSGKRKFLFDDYTRSVRSCTSSGLTRRFGGSRIETVDPVLISPPTRPHYSRYSDAMILPLHANPLCPMQNEFSRQNSERSSTSPFVTWRPRRMLENECLPESVNNSLVSQFNGLSSAATGFGSTTFEGESFLHPSFIKTSRDSYSGSYVGTYSRRHHSNEGIETFSPNGRMQNSFEPSSSRFMFYRTGRHSLFRESASRPSQSGPPEAFATSSRLAYESEAAMNSSYIPVHERGTPSSISEYGESRSPTPRSAPSRMPRRRRRQRFNRQRRLSHELLNQSLEYEEVDMEGLDSNMHLDVDDMSYEELLVLGERIGNVKTGLSDDSIQKCLKMSKHSSGTSQKNEILCSICQEEYRENDELGLLVCGHSHHPACIKQWLQLKNQCPICKAVAYSEC